MAEPASFHPDAAPASRRTLAILLGLVLFVNLAAMPGMFWSGDPFTWRAEARSLLLEGHLWIDMREMPGLGEPGQYAVRNQRNGLWYSKYGLVNSLMAVPPMLVERIVTGSVSPPALPPHLLIYNLYNVLLSLLLCAALYGITGRYARSTAARVVYVLAVFYCTYLWYYQRAQSSEIYQALFFVCYFACLTRFLDALRDADPASPAQARLWALRAWFCVLLLVLTRVLFGLLIAVTLVAAIGACMRLDPGRRWAALRRNVLLLTAPPVMILALLAFINDLKFGAPLLTGYHAWRVQDHLPTGRLQDGVWGLLFSSRFSVFLYFPPLALALLALRRFHARHAQDAFAIGIAVAIFLLTLGAIPSWRGEWTYGPRYMVFLLPVAALPFIVVLDDLRERWRERRMQLAAFAMALVLGYSALLNAQANRLDFFAYYHVRPDPGVSNEAVHRYFDDHHVGVICDDLIRYRANLDALAYVAEMRRIVAPEALLGYTRNLEALIDRGNSYWSSGRAREEGAGDIRSGGGG